MSPADNVFEICLRCCEPNPEGTSRCQKCGSPLDPSARDHPWEFGTANHHAYADAISPRAKPIIFWGAWFYYTPSVLTALSLTYLEVILRSDNDLEPLSGLDTIAYLSIPVAEGLLSLWAIGAVTRAYLFRQSKPSTSPNI